MSVSVVARFLVRGVVEGLVFTFLCCALGTALVLGIGEERDSPAHLASAPCRAGEVAGPTCLAVPAAVRR